MDDSFTLLVSFYLPFVILIYIGAVFCRPRRKSPMDMWKLRVHFMSFAYISEASLFVWNFRAGQGVVTLFHVMIAPALSLVFHFSLKLRSSVGRLPDKELNAFLVDTLFYGGFQTLASILFLAFRSTKCIFEQESLGGEKRGGSDDLRTRNYC